MRRRSSERRVRKEGKAQTPMGGGTLQVFPPAIGVDLIGEVKTNQEGPGDPRQNRASVM